MLLPNKLFAYPDTVLPLLPTILRLLDTPKTPNELAVALASVTTDPIRLIDALDCLYSLGKVTLSEEGALERC
ncbi:hypothetical protein QP880_04130 [Dermabacter hominis]|uniref:ABC-three component system middle component 7 n=1 Tax=Dermabacter hominis TaxID=36740 RepID=UPI00316ABD05|nr:hypothetical protein [Dermabacter hominis]